ncbi:hypothetical protein ACOME3_004753 [Neoechinorhynchus agilis]
MTMCIQPWATGPDGNFTIGPFGSLSLSMSNRNRERKMISGLLLSSFSFEITALLLIVAFIVHKGRKSFVLMQLASSLGQVSLICEILGIGIYFFCVGEKHYSHSCSYYIALASLVLSSISVFLSQAIIFIKFDGAAESRLPACLGHCSNMKLSQRSDAFTNLFPRTYPISGKFEDKLRSFVNGYYDDHVGRKDPSLECDVDSLEIEEVPNENNIKMEDPLKYNRQWHWRRC